MLTEPGITPLTCAAETQTMRIPGLTMMEGKVTGIAESVLSNVLNSREEITTITTSTTTQPTHSHNLFQTIQRRQRRERMVMDNVCQ